MNFNFPLDKSMSRAHVAWFGAMGRLANAITSSGTSTNRPTTGLWVGRPYWDTTLGKPIWYKDPGWVDATGAAV